jgi:hypothetical protein
MVGYFMMTVVKKDRFTRVVIGFLGVFTIFWLYLTFFQPVGSKFHDAFSISYWVMALIGGIFGLGVSRRWEGYKSVVGRAMMMFSMGLLFQVFGQLSYIYYIYFRGVAVPYPSVGDIGFFGYMPCYLYGIVLLGQASGVKMGLRLWKHQIQAVLLPSGMLLLSYAVFLRGYEFDWSVPLKVWLDFGYPLFQAFNVSMAILVFSLTKGVLGGVMRLRVWFFVLAFVAQFVADFIFLYQVSRGTWFVGGINDFMYLVSYVLMVFAFIWMDRLVGKKA